jgi:hypothetical protein
VDVRLSREQGRREFVSVRQADISQLDREEGT